MFLYLKNSRGFTMVHDTEFIEMSRFHNAEAIIEVYSLKRLSVYDSLKLYYAGMHKSIRNKVLDGDMRYYSSGILIFDFAKYYPCLKRHLDKLKFIGK